MTSDEKLTHALEFVTLRRALDHASPQGHEDRGVAACDQVQKAAERVQGAVDVAWVIPPLPRRRRRSEPLLAPDFGLVWASAMGRA